MISQKDSEVHWPDQRDLNWQRQGGIASYLKINLAVNTHIQDHNQGYRDKNSSGCKQILYSNHKQTLIHLKIGRI